MPEIKYHHQLTDTEFENQFQSAVLNPDLFNHEAHLRLAWIYINKYGINSALQKIEDQILNYVTILGAKDKYNKTLTIAATKAVHHFIQKSKSNSFPGFIIEFPRLKHSFKELINSHYTIDVFNSQQAKQEYLNPDIIPFT